MRINLDDVSDDEKVIADVEDFIGRLLAGEKVEAAVKGTWPGLTGPAAAQYLSDVAGLLVGWSMCGGCGKHVSRCTCKEGPTEPEHIVRLRLQEELRSARAAGDTTRVLKLEAVVGKPTTSVRAAMAAAPDTQEASSPETETNSAQAESPATGPRTSPLVPCAPGKHLVPESTAERNDDGSWTCFDHQASAAVRDGTADE